MGRPPLPIGTHGAIRLYHLGPSRWQARALVRDRDGAVRHIERRGRTKGEAQRRLSAAMHDRSHAATSGDLHGDSRVGVIAEAWHTDLTRHGRAPRTLEQYRRNLDRVLLPRLGEVRLRELTVARCSTYLTDVEADLGAATAKMSKSVLSGTCQFAARRDLLPRNPVRDTGQISTTPRRAPNALSIAQVRDLRTWLTYDDTAIRRDLPDFVAFMLATGLRISEASAVRWACVDLDAGTVHVTASVVRVKGRGLVLQENSSRKLTTRTLQLPRWSVDLLHRRHHGQDADEPVFPAPRGGFRDPNNTQADLRDAFARCGYDWVTSHVFRRTVATLMDQAGLSGRAAADQLGHAQPSMTMNRYMSRHQSTGAATVLDALDHTQP